MPSRQVLKAALAVRLKGAFGVVPALVIDPLAEPVAIDGVARWDASITVGFDVAQELEETLLPHVGEGVPCPAGQVLKLASAVCIKGAFGVPGPLLTDETTEVVAVDGVTLRDTGVRVAFDVVQQSTEALLPHVGLRYPCPGPVDSDDPASTTTHTDRPSHRHVIASAQAMCPSKPSYSPSRDSDHQVAVGSVVAAGPG